MPVINYEGPNATKSQKQELVKALTEADVKATGL